MITIEYRSNGRMITRTFENARAAIARLDKLDELERVAGHSDMRDAEMYAIHEALEAQGGATLQQTAENVGAS